MIGVKKYRHYLAGKRFTVITDHAALQYLLNLKKPQGRLNRLSLLLQEYDFTVQYRHGRLHQDADLLSRNPHEKPTDDDEDCDVPLYKVAIINQNDRLLISEQEADAACNTIIKLLTDKTVHENANKKQLKLVDQFRCRRNFVQTPVSKRWTDITNIRSHNHESGYIICMS